MREQVELELERAGMLGLLPELLEANATSGKQVVELVAAAKQTMESRGELQALHGGGSGDAAEVTKLTPKQQEVCPHLLQSVHACCCHLQANLLWTPSVLGLAINAPPANSTLFDNGVVVCLLGADWMVALLLQIVGNLLRVRSLVTQHLAFTDEKRINEFLNAASRCGWWMGWGTHDTGLGAVAWFLPGGGWSASHNVQLCTHAWTVSCRGDAMRIKAMLRQLFKANACDYDGVLRRRSVCNSAALPVASRSAAARVPQHKCRRLLPCPARPCLPPGRTGLHLASTKGHEEVAEILLEAGADPNAKDTLGTTPLQEAVKGSHDKVTNGEQP
jgi:hypothetical protein